MEQTDAQGFKKDQSQDRGALARKAIEGLDGYESIALHAVPHYIQISPSKEKTHLRNNKEEYDRPFGSPEKALEKLLFLAGDVRIARWLAETNTDINVGGVRIGVERYRYLAGVHDGYLGGLQHYPAGEGYRLKDSLDMKGRLRMGTQKDIVKDRVSILTKSEKEELANLSERKVTQIFRSAIKQGSRRK